MPARILVVHDDPKFRELMASALAAEGHKVTAFSAPDTAPVHQHHPAVTDIRITQSRAGVRIRVVGYPDATRRTGGWGASLTEPVAVPDVVLAVRRLMP